MDTSLFCPLADVQTRRKINTKYCNCFMELAANGQVFTKAGK